MYTKQTRLTNMTNTTGQRLQIETVIRDAQIEQAIDDCRVQYFEYYPNHNEDFFVTDSEETEADFVGFPDPAC